MSALTKLSVTRFSVFWADFDVFVDDAGFVAFVAFVALGVLEASDAAELGGDTGGDTGVEVEAEAEAEAEAGVVTAFALVTADVRPSAETVIKPMSKKE